MSEQRTSAQAWAEYESDGDFWAAMAARMRETERTWWGAPNLAVLRSACAGSPLMRLTAIWHRPVEDVCAGL